ncbi:MAG: hypothetical protein HOJ35_01370 [Bdellovibrionales bacterium]|jgi:hypothetical protein|nr:hypothetical protein [Bdellovibrionales bacterium]
MRTIELLLLSYLLTGCAFVKRLSGHNSELVHKKKTYIYVDKFGKYILERETGSRGKSKDLVVKTRIITNDKKKQELERSITISKKGNLKNKISILRPEISQYTAWYDQNKYFSEIKLNPKLKNIQIKMISPEKKWNGVQQVKFPIKGNGLYCFFSQLIECAKYTGFLSKALDAKAGQMNFYLLWDGFPYINNQFEGLEEKLFVNAKLVYDGETDKELKRFSLIFGSQSIVYLLDDNLSMSEMYWVSQGLSVRQQY